MKTLTYGTLPTEIEFYAAFEMFTGDYYTMRLSAYDFCMLTSLDLDLKCGSLTRYEKPDLYALCEALQELYLQEDWADECWAGDFCSSILMTLGFEWV